YEFGRVIDTGCLFCHNAYPAGVDDSYASRPIFRERLPEGIDCQRCHGPASKHIANPKRMTPERQMDVCLQCHLQTTSEKLPHAIRRFGRGVFSFLPGERLDEYRLEIDHAEDKFEINSAGYRFLQSACYLKSESKLTCTTCHDPHGGGSRPACLKCHVAHREPDRADCASCHMPKRRAEDAVHVTMTDHRIQRRPPAPLARRHELTLYRPAELQPAERDMYFGLALVTDGADVERGIALLRKGGPAPVEARSGLARALLTQGKLTEAAEQFRLILTDRPGLASLRADYAKVLEQLGKRPAALREYKQALAQNPDLPAARLGIARLASGAA